MTWFDIIKLSNEILRGHSLIRSLKATMKDIPPHQRRTYDEALGKIVDGIKLLEKL
jgi:hypothetical protein